MRRATRRALASSLAMVACGATLTACFEEPSPHEAVQTFLVGWQSGDYAAAAARTDGDPAKVAKAIEDAGVHLDAASFRFKLLGITRSGGNAQADFTAEVDLGENNPLFTYNGKLPLHLVERHWKVRWSPSVLHPKLQEGQRFAVETVSEGRKPIVDREDKPLQTDEPLRVATVTPAKLDNPQRLVQELAAVTGFPQDRLLRQVLSAPPNSQVPLVTFGRDKYAQLASKLDIRGLEMKDETQPVGPDSPAQIVGRVSAVTAENVQQLGGPQRAGDSVGLNGLQKHYQDMLTGSTSTRVITVDLKTQQPVAELGKWPGRSNSSVSTTIDSAVQGAADSAVAGGVNPTALVAVQASTGQVLAVGTKDMHQEKDALAGKFPAGTAFSMVAADALAKSDVSTKQRLACPPVRSVGGAQFQQPGAAGGAAPTLQANFAGACTTALASLARRVDAKELAASTAAFGIGAKWKLPLKSFAGSVPVIRSDADKAKVITGQNVQVSPLSMALAAGAAASGTWRPPVLVTRPPSIEQTAGSPVTPPPTAVPLDPKSLSTIKSLMRAGVTSGTAKPADAGSGPRVYGIAAPAGGDAQGRKRFSWFVGWRGDVAVSVLVEGGDTTAAATIAGRFLQTAKAPS
ncbi:penicillin-binding transpeptidase domain-containing protein [Sinosporangium siamense]|uniref:Penicillin-binding protein n=1 Tax=Sinosporangium siamense TaxID=1367973 RepID=A0A919V517_9ACTN|nr:penicillin-binding transpeptidase domain-containing protein [Sinosporangium siamense]GII91083.1 penicillin-binding protein [Sinosporangium siamense]